MSLIPSYTKIFNLGNDAIADLFKGEVEITEKVDGSQFRWGITPEGQVVMGSKGVQLFSKEQNGMFSEALDQIDRITPILQELHQHTCQTLGYPVGLYFYGEYLKKTKHNCLAYHRMPKNHIILFSAKVGDNFINSYDITKSFADRFDFETVPLIFKGELPESGRYEWLKEKITTTQSVLGDQLIEGVVIKNYSQFTYLGENKMPLFGKLVREEFKEKLHKEWGKISGKSSMSEFISGFKTDARILKAIQHLTENGELTHSLQDIPKIFKEVHVDIETEEKEFIKNALYEMVSKDIKRVATCNIPAFYKDYLLKKQCEENQ